MSSSHSDGNEPVDFAASAESLRRQGDAEGARALAAQGLDDEPESERGRIALALALLDLGDIGNARMTLVGLLETRDHETQLEAPSQAPSHTPTQAPAENEALNEALSQALGEAPDQAADQAQADAFHHAIEGEVADAELDAAFASAETRTDEMMSANRVVEQTLDTHSALDDDFDLTENPTYATQSMVEVLEGQGRGSEAETLRARLSESGRDESEERSESEDVDGLAAAQAAGDLHAAEPMGIEGGPLLALEGIGEITPEQLRGMSANSFGPDDAERLRIVATLESWLHNVRRNGAATNRNAEDASGDAAGGQR